MTYPDRSNWNGDTLGTGSIIWYTDGSKDGNGTGAAAWRKGSTVEIVLNFDQHVTVFQAEVRVISECAEAIVSGELREERITICSDSVSALRAVSGIDFRSTEAWLCRRALDMLSSENEVTLCWVPGHAGVIGNEKADRLAKRGAAEWRAEYRKIPFAESALKEVLVKWAGSKATDR